MMKELNILNATAAQMRIDDLPPDFAWGSRMTPPGSVTRTIF
jgi:hypothetical protein